MFELGGFLLQVRLERREGGEAVESRLLQVPILNRAELIAFVESWPEQLAAYNEQDAVSAIAKLRAVPEPQETPEGAERGAG